MNEQFSDPSFCDQDRKLIKALIDDGFKIKSSKKVAKRYRHSGGGNRFKVNLMRNGVSVRIDTDGYDRISSFTRNFTGGYVKAEPHIWKSSTDQKTRYEKFIEEVKLLKPETIIRKGNIPESHELPTDIEETTISYGMNSASVEIAYNLRTVVIRGIVGIQKNGNISTDVINEPGENVWFLTRVIYRDGNKDDIIYRDGQYYGLVDAREKKKLTSRISPDEVILNGNDHKLIKEAVGVYKVD